MSEARAALTLLGRGRCSAGVERGRHGDERARSSREQELQKRLKSHAESRAAPVAPEAPRRVREALVRSAGRADGRSGFRGDEWGKFSYRTPRAAAAAARTRSPMCQRPAAPACPAAGIWQSLRLNIAVEDLRDRAVHDALHRRSSWIPPPLNRGAERSCASARHLSERKTTYVTRQQISAP